MTRISFEDHAYFDAITSLNTEHKKSLTNMSIKFGSHRFEAAFFDTYEKVRIEDDGDLSDHRIQNKFVRCLRDRLKDYSIKNVKDKLTTLTVYAANKFGGQYTDQINDLLQKYHVLIVRKGYGERKMMKELQKIESIIDIVDSFDIWRDQVKTITFNS